MVSQGLRRRFGLNAAPLTVAVLSISALTAFAAATTAAADDQNRPPALPQSLDGVLQTLDVKAKPSEPAPEFVTRTRPSQARLHFMPPAVPHAVSPVPVKTPAQIQAAQDALDAAQVRQLNPTPPPLDLAKRSTASKAAKIKGTAVKPAADAD